METILNAADIFNHPRLHTVHTQRLVIVPDSESTEFLDYVGAYCKRNSIADRAYSACFTKKRSEFALPISRVIAEHGLQDVKCWVLDCIVDLRDPENITWVWVASELCV
jgi:hypothetical protein